MPQVSKDIEIKSDSDYTAYSGEKRLPWEMVLFSLAEACNNLYRTIYAAIERPESMTAIDHLKASEHLIRIETLCLFGATTEFPKETLSAMVLHLDSQIYEVGWVKSECFPGFKDTPHYFWISHVLDECIGWLGMLMKNLDLRAKE